MPDLNSDFVGRVGRLALKPNDKTALVPLMEAVTNGIHAITERFDEKAGEMGCVTVTVIRDLEKEELPVIGFEVEDNGVGFTDDNFKSFLTPDSRHKEKRGGKGVGRLAWLKVFEQVEVNSVFLDHTTLRRRHFNFRLADKNQVQIITDGEAETNTQPRACAKREFCKDRRTIRGRSIFPKVERPHPNVDSMAKFQNWAWSPVEDQQLMAILGAGKGVDAAAQALLRTPKAVRARATRLRLSTKRATHGVRSKTSFRR